MGNIFLILQLAQSLVIGLPVERNLLEPTLQAPVVIVLPELKPVELVLVNDVDTFA